MLAAGLVAAPAYSASLQALPDSFFPTALSGDGSTVVGFDASGTQAIRWRPSGGLTALGNLPGGSGSTAYGVSADGSVVVGEAYDDLGNSQAFRWTQAGGLVRLGYLPGIGTAGIRAYGVSANGSTVVGYADTTTGYQAFRWTQAGGMAGLGGSALSAEGVSADGTVVAGRSPNSQSFRWTQAGGVAGLGGSFVLGTGISLNGFPTSDPISADGSTIVGSILGSGSAAFWKFNAGVTSIDLPGGNATGEGEASSTSADGSVVVGWSDSYDGQEAFIWDSVNGIRSLKNVLASQGVDTTGWALYQAIGISDDGRTVLVFGVDPDATQSYWLAHLDAAPVPLPAGVWLFGSAFAGLLGFARRKA